MRVAARRAHAVTRHAVGSSPLVVAGRAADDVLPGLRAVEEWAAGSEPARRMRIERVARVRREALLAVAVRTERHRVALLAGGLIRPRLDRVPGDEVTPVNPVPVRPVRVERLRRHGPGPRRVTVRAPGLLMAGLAGRRRGPRDLRVHPGEVPLVAEEALRLEREVGQVDVTGVALPVVELLLVLRVLVAAETGAHRWHRLLEAGLLRERLVADLTLVVLLQML